jgi:hypothetical protein
MKRSLKIQLAVGIFSAAGCQLYASDHQSHPADLQPVAIYVYDLAGVSSHTLAQATEEAARILATAGVQVVWQPGPSDASEAHECDFEVKSHDTLSRRPDSRDHLVLRLVRNFPERSLPGALGYSLPDARFGVHATLFYERIEAVSKTGDIALATMLGHAIAHEIGHVLLGTTDHSPSGIMKARWGRRDYWQASMGLMVFAPREREAIQRRAAANVSTLAQTMAAIAIVATQAGETTPAPAAQRTERATPIPGLKHAQ